MDYYDNSDNIAEEEKREESSISADSSEQTENNNYNNQANRGYKQYIPYGFTPETLAEKRDIRKIAAAIGAALLSIIGITSFWSYIYYAVMYLFGYSQYDAYKIISEPAVMSLVQILLSTLLFTVPFILSAMVAGFRISDLVVFNKPKKGETLPFFLFGIGFCALSNIVVSYAGSIFEGFGFNYSVDFGENPKGVFGFLLSIISTALVPGLIEEFACRGIIFGILKKYGNLFALIVSSLVFGMMHGNFSQIPFAFLVGLVLGYIRIKTDSIIICCAVHGFNNLISVLFDYFAGGMSVMAQNTIYMFFLIICMLGAIFGILLLSKKEGNYYNIEKGESACSETQKYKWFFTSPVIIIFLSSMLIQSCLYFVI